MPVPDPDAALNDYQSVEARVRFITVKGRDRFFPVTPSENPLRVD